MTPSVKTWQEGLEMSERTTKSISRIVKDRQMSIIMDYMTTVINMSFKNRLKFAWGVLFPKKTKKQKAEEKNVQENQKSN